MTDVIGTTPASLTARQRLILIVYGAILWFLAAILARTPMQRWGEPADIAGSVVYLCSDAARFVTGVVVPIDGGYAVM